MIVHLYIWNQIYVVNFVYNMNILEVTKFNIKHIFAKRYLDHFGDLTLGLDVHTLATYRYHSINTDILAKWPST
jgi:hypothetical protein